MLIGLPILYYHFLFLYFFCFHNFQHNLLFPFLPPRSRVPDHYPLILSFQMDLFYHLQYLKDLDLPLLFYFLIFRQIIFHLFWYLFIINFCIPCYRDSFQTELYYRSLIQFLFQFHFQFSSSWLFPFVNSHFGTPCL